MLDNDCRRIEMEGGGEKTPTIHLNTEETIPLNLIDNFTNDPTSTTNNIHSNTQILSPSIQQNTIPHNIDNTLTLAMIHELIEGKRRQEREIEELRRLVKSVDRAEKEEIVGHDVSKDIGLIDFFGSQAPSPILSPEHSDFNKKFSTKSPPFFDNKRKKIEIKEDEEFMNYDYNSNGSSERTDSLKAKWTVPILTKKNYTPWKKKVDWLLNFKNLTEFVEVRHSEPERSSPKYNRYNEAYIIVANSVSDDVMSMLGELQNNPYDLYQRIKEINNPITASSRLVNRIKYFQIKCSDASSITKFCSNIESMSQKIDSFSLFSDRMLEKMAEMTVTEVVKAVIKVIDEADRLAILLGGLPDEFETQANILRADSSTTYTKAKELLEAAAFQFKSEKPNKKDSLASATEKKLTCNVCKKPGHKAADCRSRGRGRARSRGRGRDKSSKEEDEEISYMFMATTECEEESGAKYATVDSGATKHIAGRNLKDLVLNKSKLETPCRLHLPNGEKLIAREKGDVKITMGEAKSQQHFIKDVIYTDDVASNVLLVSVAKVCDKGARVLFDAKECKIQMKEKKKWKTVIQAKRRGDLYQFPLNKLSGTDEESVNLIVNRDTEPEKNCLRVQNLTHNVR